MTYIDDFRSAATAFGLADFTPKPDGQIHRVNLHGESKKSGWYKLFPDEPQAGIFGNWKTGEKQTWRSKSSARHTPEQIEQINRQREIERAKAVRDASLRARKIWDAAETATDHPYLSAKQVQAYGLKIYKGQLVVPVWQADRTLTSLQFIDAEGSKKFLRGGHISGGFHIIGKPSGKIWLAEGYATGASVYESTGDAVVVAFNAGNLPPVADAIRTLWPDMEWMVAADNDESGTGEQYAKKTGLPYVMPESVGDFNDHPMTQQVAPNQQQSVDIHSPLPDCNAKGKPLGTITNLEAIIHRLGYTVRYNVITKQEEILIPGACFTVDNAAEAALSELISWCCMFQFPTGNIQGFVTRIADKHQYNPILEWIKSVRWDGHERFKSFCNTIKAVNDPLKEILLFRWMISAVAAVARPEGVSAHGVLVLQGDQYIGKTKWFKSLVPPEMQQYIQDGLMLDPKDRDSKMACLRNWIVELGELDATFRKADIASLKAFVTQDRDVMRKAYARRESEFARRTVFFASVNPREYLHDPTGNRRFWTIEAREIDHSHNIDMQQLWAEIYRKFQRGETWFLNTEEMMMLNEYNQEFETVDPIEEMLLAKFDWKLKGHGNSMTATEILKEIGVDKPTRPQVNTCGQIVTKLVGESSRRSTKGRRVWTMPPLQ